MSDQDADQSDKPDRTVRAGRRRPSDDSGPGGRERADAPRRRRDADDDEGSSGYSGGSGGSSYSDESDSSGGGLPSDLTRSPLLLIALVLIVLFCGGSRLLGGLFGGGGGADNAPPPPQPANLQAPAASGSQPTLQPLPTRAPIVATGDPNQKWLVMLYQDADDKILEQDIYVDLNEAERIGSSDQVQIVAQVDRYRAGFQGDGDWHSTKRYYVTQDDDLNRVGSQEVADIGEANMADANTLIDFVGWAVENYPADKYVLILSDHGMGWPGGWSDPTAQGNGGARMPLAQALGDQLYLNELDAALGSIRERTGIDKFELIGMDACLMGHIEVFSALEPHARYAVASQEVEPALGWAYTSFLGTLRDNPGVTGADLGRVIVDTYIQDDQRIVDDQARAEYLGRGSVVGSLFGQAAAPPVDVVRAQLSRDVTLTTADLEALPALNASLNNLALAMQQVNQRSVAQARSYAQSFTNVFGGNIPSPYIDLANFAQLAAQASGDAQVAQAAEQLQAALSQVVIAEKNGPNKPGANGVSIYFPTSQLYTLPAAGPQSYTVAAERFASESLWDDFLAFHYTGRRFEQASGSVVVPTRGEPITAPASGGITVSPLQLSAETAGPGNPVLLSADVSGENIGYIKFMAGYFDQASNAIFIADSDYLESADTREVAGVFYPDWGQGAFTLEFEWEPIVMAISDGTNQATVLLSPESYGATPEQATYSVDGVYTFVAGDSDPRYARLLFRDGQLYQVLGFTGENGTGAPREITPQPGDSFTVLESWLDLDEQGNVVQQSQQQGQTLTFGDQMFTWKELDAAAGQYVVGFIVEDLDGKPTAVYSQVNVQ